MGRSVADVDDDEPWMEASALSNMCCSFCSIMMLVSVFGVVAFETGRAFTVGILLISVIPSFLVMFFAYWREDQHRLNFMTVTAAFMVGVIGTLAVVLFELVISRVVLDLPPEGAATGPSRSLSFRLLVAFANAFLVAALVEEVFKYVVTAVVADLKGLRDAYAIFVVGLSVAMGFAALENMGYLLSSPTKLDDGEVLGIGIARGLMSVPIHAATGSLVGVGIARNAQGEDWPIWRTLGVPFFFHGLYDFVLMGSEAMRSSTASSVGVVFAMSIVVGISWYAVRQVRQLMEDSRRGSWKPLPASERHQVC